MSNGLIEFANSVHIYATVSVDEVGALLSDEEDASLKEKIPRKFTRWSRIDKEIVVNYFKRWITSTESCLPGACLRFNICNRTSQH